MGKGIKFLLKDEQKRVRDHTMPTSIEEPLLLNPCIDQPNEHLEFSADGTISSTSKKGQYSIEIFGLYRADLVLKRSWAGDALRTCIFNISENIKSLEKPDNSTDLARIQSDTTSPTSPQKFA